MGLFAVDLLNMNYLRNSANNQTEHSTSYTMELEHVCAQYPVLLIYFVVLDISFTVLIFVSETVLLYSFVVSRSRINFSKT